MNSTLTIEAAVKRAVRECLETDSPASCYVRVRDIWVHALPDGLSPSVAILQGDGSGKYLDLDAIQAAKVAAVLDS